MEMTRIGGVVLGVLIWLSAAASASPSGQFTWTIQDTGVMAGGVTRTAAAMRNGLAWPVIIADGGVGAPGQALTLLPVASGTIPSTYWRNIGSGFFTTNPTYRLRAASSPDGRVAFAAAASSGMAIGGRISSVNGGWAGLPSGTTAVAFDKDGNLYTAGDRTVSGAGGYTGAPVVDLAVSRLGDVGVIDTTGKYWQYSPWVGSWLSATLPVTSLNPDTLDLEFDSFGRPHIVGVAGGTQLIAADFSTVSGTWSYTALASYISGGKGSSTLAANSDGTVGVSWIDSSGMLMYSYKDDVNSWATASVISTGMTGSFPVPGLVYDYAGLPVISYVGVSSGSPRILLAYDPIVVPEPAGLGLVFAASMLMCRRWRRAA